MRILANGMFGKDVNILQHTLNQRGENLLIDGWFGVKTEAAVKRFQKRNSLFVDGIAGYQTASFLGFVEKSTPEYLVIHSSASPDLVAGCDAKRIVHFHVKSLRWGKPGFSRIIERDGKIIDTWPIDYFDGIEPFKMSTQVGEIAFDLRTIHICIVGGLNPLNGIFEDTRTAAQYKSLTVLLKNILVLHPNIQIAGYNQFSNAMSPYFWVPEYLKTEAFEERNIYPHDPFHSVNLLSSLELKAS